ncbi:PAQR family membrane homeostasis protein TrhA [Solimonas terrae]|uniref:Hemolysin III family protein n=1 Tax=Solimonas terrae TaxID=1396819 RepID=A0A6M2BW24_9GAMM|nr:hemolysin III family protein [Solimonas terrae]NGY06594.1 hemolysin III family protein [Solimonas terrae]
MTATPEDHRAAPRHHHLGPVEIPVSLYSLGEEIAHAITHGVGVLAAIVGLTVLVVRAVLYGNSWHVVACSVFGATLILMYTASTLFHSVPNALPRAKHVLRVLDHSMIYFLIAGTYTPFTLVTLHGTWGWSLFAFTWGLAAVGVVFKIFATGRYEKLSLIIYLAMGWCAVVAIKPLLAHLAPGGLWLTAAGGLAYSAGVVFYLWERLRYHHAIWHLFVLTGSVLQYFAIFFYVVPGPNG